MALLTFLTDYSKVPRDDTERTDCEFGRAEGTSRRAEGGAAAEARRLLGDGERTRSREAGQGKETACLKYLYGIRVQLQDVMIQHGVRNYKLEVQPRFYIRRHGIGPTEFRQAGNKSLNSLSLPIERETIQLH